MLGNMEVYDDTYEKIAYMVKQKEEPEVSKSSKVAQNEDAGLDMFGESFDERVSAANTGNRIGYSSTFYFIYLPFSVSSHQLI